MRYEHEGISIWFGTPDAPAPQDAVSQESEISITVGVQPMAANYEVELIYRVNKGPTESIKAKWLRNDTSGRTRYYRAYFPSFQAGDIVEYGVICHCAGRQVPPPEVAQDFPASFQVMAADAQHITEVSLKKPLPPEIKPAVKLPPTAVVAPPTRPMGTVTEVSPPGTPPEKPSETETEPPPEPVKPPEQPSPAAGKAAESLLKVPAPLTPPPASPAVATLNKELKLNLPSNLIDALAAKGIKTLSDIRTAGKGSFDDLPVDKSDPGAQTLAEYVDLSVLSRDVNTIGILHKLGFRTPNDIADIPWEDFRDLTGKELDLPASEETYKTAKIQNDFLNNIAVSKWTGDPSSLSIRTKCSCEDCEAVVSPIAYLADLLDYAAKHLKTVREETDYFGKTTRSFEPVTLKIISEKYHQPMEDLLASCEEMNKKVRQVRICIEVLRHFLGEVGSPVNQNIAKEEAGYLLNVYKTLLAKLGISYTEIRLARSASDEDRKALGDRLGIEVEHLDEFPNSPAQLNESLLEVLFGLQGTRRNPLSDGVKSGEPGAAASTEQIKRWNFEGIEWNRNTDGMGNVYMVVRENPPVYEVILYKDANRKHLVARGWRDSSRGAVALVPGDEPELSGQVELDYQEDTNQIKVSVVPLFQCWHLEHLRVIWKELDWPVDSYNEEYLPAEKRLPIIDPDVIGPDDFRNPFPGNPAFDIWLERREWVDNRVKEILAAAKSDLDKLLFDDMFKQRIDEDGNQILAWPGLQQQTPEEREKHFESLRQDFSHGKTEAVETAIKDIEDNFNLTADSFLRLMELRSKYLKSAAAKNGQEITEEEWIEIASILVQAIKIERFSGWRSEEKSLRFGPEHFWFSQREPREGEWPPITLMPPFIDPDEVEPEDLPEHAIGKAALELWQSRQEEMLEALEKKLQLARETQGFQSMVNLALGAEGGEVVDLDDLAKNIVPKLTVPMLTDEDKKRIEEKELFMSGEDFNFLMEIKANVSDPQATVEPSPDEWSQVYSILAAAQKRKKIIPKWEQKEKELELDRQYWKALKARLPRWRASAETRQLWIQALRVRSRPPLIDPDLIDADHFYGSDEASIIWDDRRRQITEWIEQAETDIQTAITPDKQKDKLQETFANWLEILPEDIDALAKADEEGESIEGRLEQLDLNYGAFAYLLRVRDLHANNQTILPEEWENVHSILTQVRKRRMAAEWREKEKLAGIILSPDHFRLPDTQQKYPYSPPEPLPAWRATFLDLLEWEDNLQSRIDQQHAVIDSLRQAVSETEEEMLTTLRDMLILRSPAKGNSLDEKAQWIIDHWFIDAKVNGCQKTTRISQAIETIQGVLWSARTGQAEDTGLVLRAENFDEEWKWIGSYPTWRAAMFVFIYPENILIPTLRRYQTPAFLRLTKALSSGGRLTPERACSDAQKYSTYFEDICKLTPEATCHARTQVYREDGCSSDGYEEKELFYIFARSKKTNTVYWSVYDPADNSQTFWDQVPGLTNVEVLLGAQPYEISSDKRYIFLFATKRKGGTRELFFIKYDLIKPGWDEEQTDLDPPKNVVNFSATMVQVGDYTELPSDNQQQKLPPKGYHSPPRLLIRDLESFHYMWIRKLNSDGSDWEDDDFLPLLPMFNEEKEPASDSGANNKANYKVISDQKLIDTWFEVAMLLKVCAAYQLSESDIIVVTETHSGQLFVAHYAHKEGYRFDYQNISFELSEKSWLWRRDALWIGLGDSEYRKEITSEATRKTWIGSIIDRYNKMHFMWREDTAYYQVFSFGKISYLTKDTERNKFSLHSSLYRVARDAGPNPNRRYAVESVDAHEKSHVFHATTDVIWNFDAILNLQNLYTQMNYMNLKPISRDGPFKIIEKISDESRAQRQTAIRNVFEENLNLKTMSTSHLLYLREAYYFVPIQIALQLQRRGHYLAALDWFRTVYDYSVSGEERNIYYGLILDRNKKPEDLYQRIEKWLLDPLNPHEIAEKRPKTYTRFTLASLIRCLLDYADSEFTRDTVESVARARTLYLSALELLNDKSLQQKLNGCEKKIADLKIKIGEDQKEPEKSDLFWEALGKIGDEGALDQAIAKAGNILAQNIPSGEKRTQLNQVIREARYGTLPVSTLGAIVRERGKNVSNIQRQLLGQPEVFQAVGQVGYQPGPNGGSPEPPVGPGGFPRPGLVGGKPPIKGMEDWKPPPQPGPDVVKTPGKFIPAPFFDFCIPPNPVIKALKLHAELNLHKLRNCRNIAGMVRELEPYAAPTDTVSGLPVIGTGGQLLLPGTSVIRPTQYRYAVLVERAKQLVNLSQQVEAGLLSALEKRDEEAYRLLKARQEVQLARAQVRLQDLRVKEAQDGVELAELQRDRTQIQVEYYQNLLRESGGISYSALEIVALSTLGGAAGTYGALAVVAFAKQKYFEVGQYIAQTLSTTASLLLTIASFERRKQEWEQQLKLAEQDILIGNQQIRISQDHVRVVAQERTIAAMQTDHAKDTVEYLANKFTNVELYDWMSKVLEEVYSYFLQQATAMAKLAENQLAFERHEVPPPFIQDDYWEAPNEDWTIGNGENTTDRRGLTGSARLLKDIYQLDQYAFETDKLKLQIPNERFSLAWLDPYAFQRFRETGVLTFKTPMEMFDRAYPGHYMRLIKRVKMSVVALIPPVQGIHATLSTNGTSRVIIGGEVFQTVRINRGPELVALTSPQDASGVFELQQQSEMLLPFEGIGVDTTWEFRMPKPSNLFDYSTIADVVMTMDYTALDSDDYRQQVLQTLRPTLSVDRPFSFRHQFADQWYDLHNPDQTTMPMTVRFKTVRADFSPNLEGLKIQHIILYFSRKSGLAFEIEVEKLSFTEQENPGAVGGGSKSIEGVISTRRGNAGSWFPMIGKAPFGEWELTLPNTEQVRNRFKNEEIEDILFVITYSGRTPEWPA